jgi:hypothetical protein
MNNPNPQVQKSSMLKSTLVRPGPASSGPAAWRLSLNTILTVLFTSTVLALTGCSSVKTHIDTGKVTGHTFVFMNTGKRQAPAYADNREKVHAMIQAAITKNLAGKGVTLAKGDADLIVAYLVIAGNNADTVSINDYFGYGDDATALADKVHREQAVRGNERYYFESGTLVIDIVDAKTSKLCYRTSIKEAILRDLDPEARAKRIQTLVDQAMTGLRIGP